ncbi:MAG: hypothetical protein HC842_03250, partial [Cytophagales bacterium]|nr:hypothetical protein [Cytophagales bacterium]
MPRPRHGSSWAQAYQLLPSALAAAALGDTLVVAQGSYTPSTDNPMQVPAGVRLLGGFVGNEPINEETIDARDWATHATILSGDINTPGDSTDNSKGVVDFHGRFGAFMDGFTISGAFNYISNVDYVGLRCHGHATLRNLVIRDNRGYTRGAGLYVLG